MSLVSTRPVELAIAFGGVDIGRSIATEVENASPISSACTPPKGSSSVAMAPPMTAMIGQRRFAAEECERKLDIAYPMIPVATITMKGDICANGMAVTSVLARPVFIRPTPRASPPATIQSTDHSISERSFLPITPVAANTAKGIRATILELRPVSDSVTHRRIVTAKVTYTT